MEGGTETNAPKSEVAEEGVGGGSSRFARSEVFAGMKSGWEGVGSEKRLSNGSCGSFRCVGDGRGISGGGMDSI
jgi:hypothetical protein